MKSFNLFLNEATKVKGDVEFLSAIKSTGTPEDVLQYAVKSSGSSAPISKVMWWLKKNGYEFNKKKIPELLSARNAIQ